MMDHLKTILRDDLHLPPWFVLATGGIVSYLLLNWLLSKHWSSAWGLVAPLFLGIGIEGYEAWQVYGTRPTASVTRDPIGTIVARHCVDILIMLAIPATIVVSRYLSGNR